MSARLPGEWAWLDAALTSGTAGVPGDPVRSRIFDEVRAERDGATAGRVLWWTGTGLPGVRETVFDLLDGLVSAHREWPAAAEVAERALTGSDQRVAWTAARILAAAGGRQRVVRVLSAATDPVVRAALVDRLRDDVDPRFRSDPEPAVRLLANVAALHHAEPAEWAALDAAVLADLEAADRVLRGSWWTAGERWAAALVARDREDDCAAWAARLSGLNRVYFAREALREWRAAPGRIAPLLAGMLAGKPSTAARKPGDESSAAQTEAARTAAARTAAARTAAAQTAAAQTAAARTAAARTLMTSLAATRLAAEALLAIVDDPELGAAATVALGTAGDLRVVSRLVRMMESGPDEPGLLGALLAVVRAGADPAELVDAARRMLATDSDRYTVLRVLAAFGPAAAAAVPDLIAHLPESAFALERIGPAAAAAAPALREHAAHQNAAVARALLVITGDRVAADDYLAGRAESPGRGRTEAAVLSCLAEHGPGGLTERQHRQLRNLFERPGRTQLETAGAIWRHEGPAAAAELLAALPHYLGDDFYAVPALRVLGAMGAHARPILPLLDSIATGRHRVHMNNGGPDDELRGDEVLLAAVLAACEHIINAK
ncbi:hypothetical protein BJY16_006817 [Actinoplanes octamycinicus]|uniref:Rhodanese domain-containing protein n=1 Tax=Actinoplanes octamycinicus TaxID=135948 RepID=A0A7W7MAS7_9ACTN|nr:hypothetical protein [Actinoplanes octamycinicus]MBB4743358.1 hypothetical protein [Actinoplanes octamycinicus]GIE61874.1 hypothetical protein Aoc01nite_72760 [Actinoplanes octamycinicus]